MVIFKTLTSLTPKQILKAGLIFSFLSAALLVANAKVPQAYFTSPANILRLIVTLILTLIAHILVFYVVAYFGEPFVFVYELFTKKIPLAWPTFRPPTPLDIIFLAMPAIGVFFALSLKNYLGREKRTLIWWLAAWMTVSFFLLPFHSLLQSSEPETPAGPKDEVSQNQGQTFDGHYAGPNDSYLDVKTNAEGVVTISGQAYWYSDKTTNTGGISGPITITNGQAFYKDDQCLIDLEFTKDSVVAKEKEGSTCGGLNVSFDGKYTKEELAIKLLSTEIPAGGYEFVEGRKADCQPEFFDPKITKFTKVKTGLSANQPQERYQLEGDLTPTMMVNGFDNEGDSKIKLNSPYDFTWYGFSCASSFSAVVEITKNGQRQALYTHITNKSLPPDVSSDKRYLFLANNIKGADGTWEYLVRIVDLENNKSVKLPANMKCVSNNGYWIGNNLITYSDLNAVEKWEDHIGYLTQFCLWDTAGRLKAQVGVNLYWSAGAAYYLNDKIGLLPNNPDIFYAYSNLIEKRGKCFFYLQDLKDQNRNKKFEITDADIPYCPEAEFDLPSFNFDSKEVRFRIITEDASGYPTTKKIKKAYGEWQVAKTVEK